nr:uncharacterized protein LOC119182983 [Rhipicephalus microplus]
MDMPPDHTMLLAEQVRVLRATLLFAPTPDSWATCEQAWSQAVALATETVRLPPSTPGRPAPDVNSDNATEIQRLYRRNRLRAVHLIMKGPTRSCTIPTRDIQDHWASTWSPRKADTSAPFRPAPLVPVSMASFSTYEVLLRLRKSENTAPGPDRLSCQNWRSVVLEAHFLSAPFNACVHHHRNPDSWRTSRTVLIYKKGDPSVPGKWRPIALGCTASKLYAKCIASRLQTWIMDHQVLSKCQKGFLPYDGVFELNYLFQHCMDAVKAYGMELSTALLDFPNAYGSVPHKALLEALQGSGAGETFAALIKDLYENNQTVIGCPLSGLLFNLVIDTVVRGVLGTGDDHNILAYADDLTPLADCSALLQQRIDMVEMPATPIALSLNPSK